MKNFVPYPKRHLEDFPAIKIGRLAVCSQTKGNGIGKTIIAFILDLAINQNKICACKLITVDAYIKSLGFYEKMKFKYLTDEDKDDKETRQMYIDLTPIINADKEIAQEN